MKHEGLQVEIIFGFITDPQANKLMASFCANAIIRIMALIKCSGVLIYKLPLLFKTLLLKLFEIFLKTFRIPQFRYHYGMTAGNKILP